MTEPEPEFVIMIFRKSDLKLIMDEVRNMLSHPKLDEIMMMSFEAARNKPLTRKTVKDIIRGLTKPPKSEPEVKT